MAPVALLGMLVANLLLVPLPSVATSEVNATDKGKNHCIYVISPMTDEDKAAKRGSKVLKTDCFDTKEEKDKAIGQSITSTASSQTASGYYIIFELFQRTNYSGDSRTWVSYSGCAGSWAVYNLVDYSFDDWADSARAGCGRIVDTWRDPGYVNYIREVNPVVSDFGFWDNNTMSSWAAR